MVDMKKSMIFWGCLALLMAGCNKVEKVEAPAEKTALEAPEHLIVDITVSQEGETRAVKKTWDAGDKIYVAFDHFFTSESNFSVGAANPAYYMTLTYNGYTWQSAFSNSALEQYLLGRTSGTLAAFYSSTVDSPLEYSCTPKLGMVGRLNPVPSPGVAGFSMRATSNDGIPYSVTNGKLTATLPMEVLSTSVYFYLDGISASNASRYSFLEKNDLLGWLQVPAFMVRNTKSDMSGEWKHPGTTQSAINQKATPAVSYGNGVFFAVGIFRSADVGVQKDYVIQIIDNMGTPDDDTDDAVYTLNKTATLSGKEVIELPPLSDSKWVKSWVVNSGTVNGHNWVRMGDGTKWATENYTGPGSISMDQKYYYSWSFANRTTLWQGWRVPTRDEWRSLGRGYHTFEHVYVGGYIASRVRASNTGQQLYLPGWGALDENEQSLTALKEYDPVTYQPIYEINPYGFYWTNYYTETSGTYYAFITDVEGSPVTILSDEADGSWDASYVAVRLVVDE